MSDSTLYPQASGAVKAKYTTIGSARVPVFNRGSLLPGMEHCLRARVAIADINNGTAAATLLPAIAGRSYRVHDWAMIAVGGSVGAVTTVNLNGTYNGSTVAIGAGAQANLTRSTLVRAGGTGGTVLADGASFLPMDANTSIRVLKNGSDITTATHVDFLVTYTLTDES